MAESLTSFSIEELIFLRTTLDKTNQEDLLGKPIVYDIQFGKLL